MKKSICGVLLVCIMIALSGCDDQGARVKRISIEEFPDRITYLAREDQILDISGCKIKRVSNDGTVAIVSVEESGYVFVREEEEKGISYSEVHQEFYKIDHIIDFNFPGVYRVDIVLSPGVECSFPIEVIDMNNFSEITKEELGLEEIPIGVLDGDVVQDTLTAQAIGDAVLKSMLGEEFNELIHINILFEPEEKIWIIHRCQGDISGKDYNVAIDQSNAQVIRIWSQL